MPDTRVRVLAFACLLALLSTSPRAADSPKGTVSPKEISRQIKFGADMARQGNWREAIFRWQRALKLAPGNPRIHNNLAVAHENLGEYDKALQEYRAALAIAGARPEIMENHELFLKFYERFKEETPPVADEPPARPSEAAGAGEPSAPAEKDQR